MAAIENLLLSLTFATALTFIAICVSIYYTHKRAEVMYEINKKITDLNDK